MHTLLSRLFIEQSLNWWISANMVTIGDSISEIIFFWFSGDCSIYETYNGFSYLLSPQILGGNKNFLSISLHRSWICWEIYVLEICGTMFNLWNGSLICLFLILHGRVPIYMLPLPFTCFLFLHQNNWWRPQNIELYIYCHSYALAWYWT